MRLYVQWARAAARDWEPVEVARAQDWSRQPAKPAPVGGEAINLTPGWVNALNCQGITFDGYDHYAVEPAGDGLRVTVWNDDPVDFPPGLREASVWTLLSCGFDPRVGQVNTRQTLTVYAEAQARSRYPSDLSTGYAPVEFLPWVGFTTPAASLTRHGIWLPDPLYAAHVAAVTRHGWREWIGDGA